MEITGDGKTVWINDLEGVCIGRFGKNGIDIHRTFSEQIKTGKQCLKCKAGRTNFHDWVTFKDYMKILHNVVVDDTHKPRFIP